MQMHLSIVLVTVFTVRLRANLLQECAKLYHPGHYMNHLPSLQLPYVGDVPIPNNIPQIKPSAVAKTKAIKVITSYVYKNPVCVKYTTKKGMCKQDNGIKHKGAYEKLVTKEYFVKDRKSRSFEGNNRHRREFDDYEDKDENLNIRHHQSHITKAEDVDNNNYLNNLESSESFTQSKENRKTPELLTNNVNNMLIEDRLDQLETILPHYTRRRTYETSTITVTKVLSNRRTMATLLAKNCIPYGFELCDTTTRKRQSKVARPSNDSVEERFFFG